MSLSNKNSVLSYVFIAYVMFMNNYEQFLVVFSVVLLNNLLLPKYN